VNKEYRQRYYLDHKQDLILQAGVRRDAHRKKVKEYVNSYKLNLGCESCGYAKCAGALEAHHHEGDKGFELGKARDFSLKKIKSELQKCKILCANCHRELHAAP
jgi:transcription elongation factor Elf1